MTYFEMNRQQLEDELAVVKKKYEELVSLNLSLNMARGKPEKRQLDLSNDLLCTDLSASYTDSLGTDCRNYGGLDGLNETKELFAEILGMDKNNIIVGGNSSLNMMFDTVSQCMTHGMGFGAWAKEEKVKFICPVPGYDRHFGVTEYFGIEMIPVKNTENGPDMEIIKELIKDKSVKGMWCVPKYSNPQGITYSDDTVRALASMKPAAKDFRIFWDNAYAVHDLYDEGDTLLNIYDECLKNGNEDMVFMFTSTSKITFPGAGVAAVAASDENIKRLKQRMNFQTIGPDKINQLRHLKYFKNLDDVKEQMKKHAAILRPKFEAVLEEFDKELLNTGIAKYTRPKGGYFISLDVLGGTAKRVETLCKNAGMVLTKVGATYPYGIDPDDSNIRIAPSFPSVDEISLAAKLLSASVKYAALEKLLEK